MSLNKYLKKNIKNITQDSFFLEPEKKNVYNIYRIRFEEDERANSLSSLTHEN